MEKHLTPDTEAAERSGPSDAEAVRRRELVLRLARAAIVPAVIAAAAASTQPAHATT